MNKKKSQDGSVKNQLGFIGKKYVMKMYIDVY